MTTPLLPLHLGSLWFVMKSGTVNSRGIMPKVRKAIEEQYDRIVEVFEAIPLDGSVSVLTGRNGSGKSLIRQQLNFRVRKKEKGKSVAHASMQQRTGGHAHMGALASMFRDTDWNPTSLNTLNFLDSAIGYAENYGGYLVLDEIEMGCSEETLRGIVLWLNEHLRPRIKGTMGCMVITHSRCVVECLDFDHWFNLDGFDTPEAWMARRMKPADLEKLKKDSLDLFRYVQSKMEKKKK
jgi:hypothetical protein